VLKSKRLLFWIVELIGKRQWWRVEDGCFCMCGCLSSEMEIKVEGRNKPTLYINPEANKVDVTSCKVNEGLEGNDSLESGSGGARASEAGTGAGARKKVWLSWHD
jgi:hypothetical protein